MEKTVHDAQALELTEDLWRLVQFASCNQNVFEAVIPPEITKAQLAIFSRLSRLNKGGRFTKVVKRHGFDSLASFNVFLLDSVNQIALVCYYNCAARKTSFFTENDLSFFNRRSKEHKIEKHDMIVRAERVLCDLYRIAGAMIIKGE